VEIPESLLSLVLDLLLDLVVDTGGTFWLLHGVHVRGVLLSRGLVAVRSSGDEVESLVPPAMLEGFVGGSICAHSPQLVHGSSDPGVGPGLFVSDELFVEDLFDLLVGRVSSDGEPRVDVRSGAVSL